MNKDLLRAELLESRAKISHEDHVARSLAISEKFLEFVPYKDHKVAGLYDPIRHEVTVAPLIVKLMDAGLKTSLPVIQQRETPLTYRAYSPGDDLVDGLFGTKEPKGEEVLPTLIVVPVVGFSRDGHRLGYGGGYYDRTLVTRRDEGAVLAVGLAFHEQERQEIEPESHDQRLDMIVTDREVLTF